MLQVRLIPLILVFVSLNACASNATATSPAPELVPIHAVVDAVKDELNAYLASTPAASTTSGACSGDINLAVKNVTLTLNTTAQTKNNPTAGISDPIGVVKLDPSFEGSYSNSNTTQIVIPLEVEKTKPQPVSKGDHPIAQTIAYLRDELIKVDHSKTPCLRGNKDPIKVTIDFDVVKTNTGGFTLQLVIFKIGDKVTSTSEYHQTLSFELGMGNNNPFFMLK